MDRYIVFGHMLYEQQGGMNDYLGTRDNLRAAFTLAIEGMFKGVGDQEGIHFSQVLDTEMNLVYRFKRERVEGQSAKDTNVVLADVLYLPRAQKEFNMEYPSNSPAHQLLHQLVAKFQTKTEVNE